MASAIIRLGPYQAEFLSHKEEGGGRVSFHAPQQCCMDVPHTFAHIHGLRGFVRVSFHAPPQECGVNVLQKYCMQSWAVRLCEFVSRTFFSVPLSLRLPSSLRSVLPSSFVAFFLRFPRLAPGKRPFSSSSPPSSSPPSLPVFRIRFSGPFAAVLCVAGLGSLRVLFLGPRSLFPGRRMSLGFLGLGKEAFQDQESTSRAREMAVSRPPGSRLQH